MTYVCAEDVILIAFPLQQWLHEHVSMLHYMYTPCLILYSSEKLEGTL
jgi:hypothetical protein